MGMFVMYNKRDSASIDRINKSYLWKDFFDFFIFNSYMHLHIGIYACVYVCILINNCMQVNRHSYQLNIAVLMRSLVGLIAMGTIDENLIYENHVANLVLSVYLSFMMQ